MENLITLQVRPDARIADVAVLAVTRANRTLDPVAFRFRGVLGLAMPGDSADGVLGDWLEDCGAALRLAIKG